MEDLLQHFSGLGPEVLNPPLAQRRQLEDMVEESPRVVSSFARPAATSPRNSTLLTSTTAVKQEEVKDTCPDTSSRQAATTPSTSGRPPTHFGDVRTMDLHTYRELFYGSGAKTRADETQHVGNEDGEDDGDYIRHFSDKCSIVQTQIPNPGSQPYLLSEITKVNSECSPYYESSDEVKEFLHPNEAYMGPNGYHAATEHLDTPSLDEYGEPAPQTSHDNSSFEDIVEQKYSNNIEPDESKGVFDEAASVNNTITRTVSDDACSIHNTNEAVSFSQRLRELHQHDMARDELLTNLSQEVQDLRRALSSDARGSQSSPGRLGMKGNNARAAAAERSLVEARQDMQKNPFVCVLVDGEGYNFHEDLLKSGEIGGIEAADRLAGQIQNYMAKFNNSKSWDILVNVYLDVEGIMNKCDTLNVSLRESSIRAFMSGFTKSYMGPLFNITDVGHVKEITCRKIEGMFHLFANNVHCRRIFFGCCHDNSYAGALAAYTGNPLIAAKITLIKSGDKDLSFESMNFDVLDLHYVFRPISLALIGTAVATNGFGEYSESTVNSPSTLSAQPTDKNGAIIKWQEAADHDTGDIPNHNNAYVSAPPLRRPSASPKKGKKQGRSIFLNINNERVDPPPEDIDFEVKETILDLIEERDFCVFYHLGGGCLTDSLGKSCRYRHGPLLNKKELLVLRYHVMRIPCDSGSNCRYTKCIYGHICLDQPSCPRGARCQLYRFHNVDATAVKVWKPT